MGTPSLTLLEPQSRFGEKPLKFQVVCPQNGTAVLNGLSRLGLKDCTRVVGTIYLETELNSGTCAVRC